jgi:hypothetical protein
MPQDRYTWPFRIACLASIFLTGVLLHVLGIPLLMFSLFAIPVVLLGVALVHPSFALGATLAFIPMFPLTLYIARFFGPHFLMSNVAVGCDRAILLFLVCILWWRNGIKLTEPDWFLLACLGIAVARLIFGGSLLPVVADFSFIIAYAAGRVTVLTPTQEASWAKRAVWIAAVSSIVGMGEIFILGETPRTILYLAVTNGTTENGELNGTFRASGFTGFRESGIMSGPIPFASLCMVALILCWVYRHKLLPAGMIFAGLICSVTRSGWLGTAVAIPFLAVVMGQRKRLLPYAAVGLVFFLAAIPVLGLGDYILATKTGQEGSALDHKASLVEGLGYVIAHPLGSGPGNVGMYSTKENDNGVFFESTYLTLAGEYGIAASLCFVGFLFSAARVAWRQRTQLGYAAVGTVVGFGAVMVVVALHTDFGLASWLWFPVGLAVRSSAASTLGAAD